MIHFFLALTLAAFAGPYRPIQGKLISYNDKDITLETRDGKKVKVPKARQTTEVLKLLDKYLGKQITLDQ